jgi:hypothetical protein
MPVATGRASSRRRRTICSTQVFEQNQALST